MMRYLTSLIVLIFSLNPAQADVAPEVLESFETHCQFLIPTLYGDNDESEEALEVDSSLKSQQLCAQTLLEMAPEDVIRESLTEEGNLWLDTILESLNPEAFYNGQNAMQQNYLGRVKYKFKIDKETAPQFTF